MTRARKTKKPEIYITLAGLKKLDACDFAQRCWGKAFRNKRVTLNRANLRILYRQRVKDLKEYGRSLFNNWILINHWINWLLRSATTENGNSYWGDNESECLDNLARLRKDLKNPIK